MNWTHRTMIVPDQYVALARALAAGIAQDSGAGMWTTPLSANGTGAPTHWISAGLIEPPFAEMLVDAQLIFAAAKGSIPLSDLQNMLAASVIRADADPHAVLKELNLKMINTIT